MVNYSALKGTNFGQRTVKYIEFPMNPNNKNSKKNGKLLPSYRITFRQGSKYAGNNINTAAKIAQYVRRRRAEQLTFLFDNLYRNLFRITRVVNENSSFPNNSWFQKGVQKLSTTNGGIKGFIRSELINAKNQNNKRKKILSNFLSRYASNKRV